MPSGLGRSNPTRSALGNSVFGGTQSRVHSCSQVDGSVPCGNGRGPSFSPLWEVLPNPAAARSHTPTVEEKIFARAIDRSRSAVEGEIGQGELHLGAGKPVNGTSCRVFLAAAMRASCLSPSR